MKTIIYQRDKAKDVVDDILSLKHQHLWPDNAPITYDANRIIIHLVQETENEESSSSASTHCEV